MKEKGNVILLLLATLLATVGFAANKFIEGIIFKQVCNLNICFSSFELVLIGWIFLSIIFLFLFL